MKQALGKAVGVDDRRDLERVIGSIETLTYEGGFL